MGETISHEQIETYAEDGVVCLRGVLSDDWVELLRVGLERNRAEPSDRARFWNRSANGESTFYDSQSWLRIPEYRSFVLDSPMGELTGRLMGGSVSNFFFDAVFLRTAGTQFRTPFHQDEPFWSVSGFDCCSVWTPLTAVRRRSALEFVRGSHRWGHRYAQHNFGSLTGDARDQVVYDNPAELVPFPDIEGERDRFEILSWDMEPGDVAVFNARVIHGGSGLLEPGVPLDVFNTQWLGDDVRVCFRPEGMDPDHREVMTDAGLAPGDRVGGVLYPEVWRRECGSI